MARVTKKRESKKSYALIVDGKDEWWYMAKVKEHYPCTELKNVKLKPELPSRKQVKDLFDLAEAKLKEDYSFVILILDLDEPLKDASEMLKFNDLYQKYLLAISNKLSGQQKRKYGWMENMLLVINNPCLEYWYLLHYNKTSKHYSDFAALLPDLKKIPAFSNYSKNEAYYNNHPDIYERLGGDGGLKTARKNAVRFDSADCNYQGCSEMNLIFDYFDKH
ncbi:MAG: RloB domain-containing protein [Bacteroidales bacterium]|nr:RloB domain-containing protein [Bacteroidales bacterium]